MNNVYYQFKKMISTNFWLLLLTLLLPGMGALQAQVTIGTGSASQEFPFRYSVGYSRTAAIYTAGELNTASAGGTITTLSWYSPDGSLVTDQVIIYLKAVGTTTAVAHPTWANAIAGATQVYSGTPASWTSGWNTINITDFPISVGQNLEVLVETNVGASGTSGGATFAYTTGGINNVSFWYVNSTPPTNQSPLLTTNTRPNIMIGGLTTPTCIAPTDVTVSSITTTAAVLNWTAPASAPGSGYEYYYSTSATEPVLSTTISGSTLTGVITANLSSLTPGTIYYAWVRSRCGGGNNVSAWSLASSFITAFLPPANDDCAGAITVPVNANMTCTSVVAGGVGGATASAGPAACGLYEQDVWYKFVATASAHVITLTYTGGSTSTFTFQVLTDCVASTSLACGNAQTPVTLNGLTPGNTYYLRISPNTGTTTETSTFTVCVTRPADMSYASSAPEQAASVVSPNTMNQPIFRIPVTVNGLNNPLTLTQLNFNTTGTTNVADISAARVYYTGTNSTFDPLTATPFGSTVNAPNGTFNITGSQVLTGGTVSAINYFWLVYDVPCGAEADNALDARITGLTVGGNLQVPVPTNPPGNLTILAASSYSTVADGDWNSSSTWSCGAIPASASADVAINNEVTVSASGMMAGNVTINSGASLTMNSGGTLMMGTAGGGNVRLANNGTLTLTGGALTVNGNVEIGNGSTFNQSAGTLTIDGNSGSAGTSVSSADLLLIRSSSGTVTGGTITIVDPLFNTSFSNYALQYSGGSNLVWGPNHILRLGDGVSTDLSNNSFGFSLRQESAGRLVLGQLQVSGGAAANRWVTPGFIGSIFVGSTLTIDANSEFRYQNGGVIFFGPVFSGDIINNGIMTVSDFPVTLAAVSGSSTAANPAAQTISGSGVFRNLVTSATASFLGLTVDNSSTAGVTLAVPLSVSNDLILTAGKIHTTSANLLTVGYDGDNTGTITRTAGSVDGPLKKWIAAGTGATTFAVGDATYYKPVTIDFTTAPSAGGTLTATFSNTPPALPAPSLTEPTGSLPVDAISQQGSWFVEAGDGLTGGLYTATFTGAGVTDVIDYNKTVLVKRPSSGGAWVLNGTHVATTGTNTNPVLSRTGMSGFSEFAIGGENNVALPIRIEYFRGSRQNNGQHLLDWKLACENTPSVTTIVERSSDGRSFAALSTLTVTEARCAEPFTYTDATPLAGMNYYRLTSVDVDGKKTYSAIVALLNSDKSFNVLTLVPNPVKEAAVLGVTSATATKMELVISDVTGRQLQRQSVNLAAGNNQVTLSFAHLAKGIYQISCHTKEGENRKIRFVKQ